MTKHSKYYWDTDRNTGAVPNSTGTEFKSTYIGDENDALRATKKKQREINIIITGFRILGYAFILFSLVLASCVLVLSELISWILIFDNKK